MPLEGKLKEVIDKLMENTNNSLDTQEVIDIDHIGSDKQKHQLVTLFLGDKYAQFHDEYTQLASSIPDLKPLADYVLDESNGWDNNLD